MGSFYRESLLMGKDQYGATTVSITSLIITTFNIMTLSIITLIIKIKRDTQQNNN